MSSVVQSVPGLRTNVHADISACDHWNLEGQAIVDGLLDWLIRTGLDVVEQCFKGHCLNISFTVRLSVLRGRGYGRLNVSGQYVQCIDSLQLLSLIDLMQITTRFRSVLCGLECLKSFAVALLFASQLFRRRLCSGTGRPWSHRADVLARTRQWARCGRQRWEHCHLQLGQVSTKDQLNCTDNVSPDGTHQTSRLLALTVP